MYENLEKTFMGIGKLLYQLYYKLVQPSGHYLGLLPPKRWKVGTESQENSRNVHNASED